MEIEETESQSARRRRWHGAFDEMSERIRKRIAKRYRFQKILLETDYAIDKYNTLSEKHEFRIDTFRISRMPFFRWLFSKKWNWIDPSGREDLLRMSSHGKPTTSLQCFAYDEEVLKIVEEELENLDKFLESQSLEPRIQKIDVLKEFVAKGPPVPGALSLVRSQKKEGVK